MRLDSAGIRIKIGLPGALVDPSHILAHDHDVDAGKHAGLERLEPASRGTVGSGSA